MFAETMWSTGRRSWYWLAMKQELRKVEQNCQPCQENNMSKVKTIPVVPDDVAEMGVMERVSIDAFHHANVKYLVIIDRASGYTICKDEKRETTECLTRTLTEVFNTYGYPVILRSDGAPGFRSTFDEWCKSVDIGHETSSPMNSRSYGLAESACKKAKRVVKRTGATGCKLQALVQAMNLAVARNGSCPADHFWSRQVDSQDTQQSGRTLMSVSRKTSGNRDRKG